MSRTDLEPSPGWVPARWVKILDRIEHRQPDVGLRFWGPPLWLEVTMVGPDSDSWPTVTEQTSTWDWQSSAPCVELASLANERADDDCLLAIVGRYTVENLILNAVHEIGEWLRFDGRRLFPAHLAGAAAFPDRDDDQGNGVVTIQVEFARPVDLAGVVPIDPADHENGRRLVKSLTEGAAPSRFTYLPDTSISYEPAGPVIHMWSGRGRTTAWWSTWSDSTLRAVGAGDPTLVAHVGRDVHKALVLHEADRICRAFHIDGVRPWRLATPDPCRVAEAPSSQAHDPDPLSISIDHAQTLDAFDGRTHRASGLLT